MQGDNMWKKIREWFKKNRGLIIISFLASIITITILQNRQLSQQPEIKTISYQEFEQLVEEEKVDSIYYNKSNEWMTITLFNVESKTLDAKERLNYQGYTNEDKRNVSYPAYEEFRHDMLSNNINMIIVDPKVSFIEKALSIVSLMFPLLWVFIIMRMLISSTQGNVKRKEIIQTSNVKFTDIIGHEEILEDVKFITELIKNPKLGDDIGAKVPKGILLSGEPGTGKTLIAKAIAGEAGVPFLYQNASSFIDRFVGMGAKNVRDLFKLAKENSPCVLFIDEIDAIGGNRNNGKGTSENDQTINALLQEMDGFTGREGIFIIAATNRPDILDSALVRAGRFDRQIIVSAPRDWGVRKDLFEHYLNKFKVLDDVNIVNLSKQTAGFTGADIAAICNEASIIAVMQEKDAIDMDCIEEAIDKKIFKGNRAKKEKYFEDKKIVAYHESGHAVMSYLLGEPIARASIQSTVSGVGGVVFNEDKDSVFQTNIDFENRVLICYAGRASEEIKFNSVTTGASNDITQATNVMMNYIEKFGFDKEFGLLDIGVLSKEHLINSEEITNKLSNMSRNLYEKSLSLLKDNYNLVETLANKLLDVGTLSGDEITELFNNCN
jgi:cell division protease FtsH